MFENEIKQLFEEIPEPISPMINLGQAKYIIKNLSTVLHLPGDIVELGCNIGTTTLYMQKFLNMIGSDKKIHVYDSFEGLPDKSDKDESEFKHEKNYLKGDCPTSLSSFLYTFDLYNCNPPENINIGWFNQIEDSKYPEKVCFAFFDGDFYTSIMDSFNIIYKRMCKGGIILIHDYEYEYLPGVKIACDEFLKDKSEKIVYNGNCVGKLIKE